MAEYIGRENTVKTAIEFLKGKVSTYDIVELADAIESLPTADVAEVKHGTWKKRTDKLLYCECIKCSICGEEFCPPDNEFTFDHLPNYCSNCGADMREKASDT